MREKVQNGRSSQTNVVTWLKKQIWPLPWAILTFVYIFACFSFRLSGIRARPVLTKDYELMCTYPYDLC